MLGSVPSRRVLAIADQAASSLSNMLVFILVARSFDAAQPVGAFGLAMVVYTLILGAVRALVGEPLLSLYSPADASVRQRLVADLQGSVLFFGAVCAVVLAVGSIAIGGLSGSALTALAIVLPLVLVQDAWRFVLIIDRPGAALCIDLVWLVAVLVVVPLAPATATVSWYVVVWGLAGGLGAVAGTLLGWHGGLRCPHPWRWVVDHRETSVRFFNEFLTAQAASQLVLVALGGIAGLGALATAKASQVFYGPLNTLYAGIYLAVVPEGARARQQPRRLWRLGAAASGVLATAALLWMVVGLTVPGSWGSRVFGGEVWDGARDLMVPMGLAMIAGGLAAGGLVGVRSLGDARRSLGARLRSTPWQVVGPLLGAILGEARGFALGFAAGHAATAVIWWRAFRDGLGRPAEQGTIGPVAAPADPGVGEVVGGR
jgi:hypothetical protein